jgi:DNA polymerase III epsilon subunit-like protein
MAINPETRLSGHSQAYHWNGHLVCAIDTETTGTNPNWHEIVQVAVVPLKSDLTVNTKILPFYMEIAPDHPERTEPRALDANKLDVYKLMAEAMDSTRVADLFEEWFTKLNLAFRKGIIPLAHNWPFDAAFLRNWLGNDNFNHYFYSYRDTMSVMNHLNDIADINNETWPFPKQSLGSLCNRLTVENKNEHDALGDAVATAECYRRLIYKYKIYG